MIKTRAGISVATRFESGESILAGLHHGLKTARSKSFSFRSKNNMEKGAMSQWGSLQKSIIESNDREDSYPVVDEAAGEYKEFAQTRAFLSLQHVNLVHL